MKLTHLAVAVQAAFTPIKENEPHGLPDIADFEVSEEAAMKQYEQFLLAHPGSNSGMSAEESDRKFKVFRQNLARINYYNAMDRGTAEYGVTEFATMTVEEFTKHQTGLKMKPRKKQFKGDRKLRFKKDLPEEWDWTEHGVVTGVKNQGMCGSCWAFSTTGNIEGVWAKQTGELVELSEQELVDCDQVDQGCNGGLMDDAFAEVVRLGGLETETDYGYDGRKEECHFEPNKVRVKINGSMDIEEDEEIIAEALVEHGPLAIALNAAWMQFYRGGVSHPIKALCDPEGLDHGVLLVGYGVENHTNWRHWHPRPYWKIKNSWGPNWGEDGFYRIYRGEGVCGVNKYVTTSIIDWNNDDDNSDENDTVF